MLLCLAVAAVVAPVGYWVLANSKERVRHVGRVGVRRRLAGQRRGAAGGGRRDRAGRSLSPGRRERRRPGGREAAVRAHGVGRSLRSRTRSRSGSRPTGPPRRCGRARRRTYVSSDGRVLSQDVAKNSTLPVIRVAHGRRADAGPARPGRDDRRGARRAPRRAARVRPPRRAHHKLELGDAGLVAVIGRGMQVRLGPSTTSISSFASPSGCCGRCSRRHAPRSDTSTSRCRAGRRWAGRRPRHGDEESYPSHAPLDREGQGPGYSPIASRAERATHARFRSGAECDIQPSSRG